MTMRIAEMLDVIGNATPAEAAAIAHAAIQRGGEHGREFGVELGKLVENEQGDFDERAEWVADCAAGNAPA